MYRTSTLPTSKQRQPHAQHKKQRDQWDDEKVAQLDKQDERNAPDKPRRAQYLTFSTESFVENVVRSYAHALFSNGDAGSQNPVFMIPPSEGCPQREQRHR
jgi:hypothetical protein